MRFFIVCLLLCSGCALTKEKVGDYVTEAAMESVQRKIDEKLAVHGLSLAKVKALADQNKDGRVTKSEVIETAKALAKDYVTLKVDTMEAKSRAQFAEETKRMMASISADGRRRREEERRERQEQITRLEKDRAREKKEFLEKVATGKLTPEDLKKYEESLAGYDEKIKTQREELEAEQKSNFWAWLWSSLSFLFFYLIKQWWGAGKYGQTKADLAEAKAETAKVRAETAKTNERISFLERISGRDLNRNGIIGGELKLEGAGESET